MAAKVLGTMTQNIISVMLDRRKGGRILEDNHPCSHRHIELLVRIDGDRVGPLDSVEQEAVTIGKEGRPTPGGIDVKMTADLPGEIGHCLQWVDIAGFGRSGDADQCQGENVLVLKAPAFFSQKLLVHAIFPVDLDLDQVVPAETEKVGGLAEGVMSPLGDEDRNSIGAVMLQCPAQPLLGNAAKCPARGKETVARHPERRDVGDGAAGAEGPQGMLAVMNPRRIEVVGAAIDQVMKHCEDLPFHRGEGLGGFHLDQILVEGGHEACQGEHEVGERRGHMTDKTGCSCMDRLGDQVLLDELGIFGDVGRLFGDGKGREVCFDFFQVALDCDDVGL